MARAGAVRARSIARTVAAVPLSSRGPPEPRCCSTVVTVKTVAFLVLHIHFTTSPENANVANHRSQLQSNGTQEAWPVISLRLLTTGSLSTATKLTNSQKFLLRYTRPKHGRLHRKRLRKLQKYGYQPYIPLTGTQHAKQEKIRSDVRKTKIQRIGLSVLRACPSWSSAFACACLHGTRTRIFLFLTLRVRTYSPVGSQEKFH